MSGRLFEKRQDYRQEKRFFVSHCCNYRQPFQSMFALNKNREYSFEYSQILKERKLKMKFETTDYTEIAVKIEKIIEGHNNEKVILHFLISANYYHNLICLRSPCKIKKFINSGNVTSLNDFPAESV